MLVDDLQGVDGLIEAGSAPPIKQDQASSEDSGLLPTPESWNAPERLRAEMILAMTEYARWLTPKLKDGLALVGVYEAMAMLISQMKSLQVVSEDQDAPTRDRVMAAKASAELATSVAELAQQLAALQPRPIGQAAQITNKPPPAGAILISNQVLMRDGGKSQLERP
jgi:hypothetical protein